MFEKSKGSSCEPTPQREEEENLPETTCADESMVAETPQRKFESPNDTGTLMKHPASGDPTPQFKGTKKRLVTIFKFFSVCCECSVLEGRPADQSTF